MTENQKNTTIDEKQDEELQSPSEKLEENKPLGSLIPGVEKLESVEVKKEVRPNTE
jgi:hypothetical protein